MLLLLLLSQRQSRQPCRRTCPCLEPLQKFLFLKSLGAWPRATFLKWRASRYSEASSTRRRALHSLRAYLLGLGGRTPVATAASEALAASSVSASYSALSRSASDAGPCVAVPGGVAAPAAVGGPSRSAALPAVASAAGRDDSEYYFRSPS